MFIKHLEQKTSQTTYVVLKCLGFEDNNLGIDPNRNKIALKILCDYSILMFMTKPASDTSKNWKYCRVFPVFTI